MGPHFWCNGDVRQIVNEIGADYSVIMKSNSDFNIKQVSVALLLVVELNSFSNTYGLVSDTLLFARVVLISGKIINASETKNRDLF